MTSHTVSLHWTWSTSWLNKVNFSTAPRLQSSHYKSLQAAAAWFFSLKHSKRAVSLLLCCDWSVAVTMFNYSNDLSWVEAPGVVTIVWSRQWQHPGHWSPWQIAPHCSSVSTDSFIETYFTLQTPLLTQKMLLLTPVRDSHLQSSQSQLSQICEELNKQLLWLSAGATWTRVPWSPVVTTCWRREGRCHHWMTADDYSRSTLLTPVILWKNQTFRGSWQNQTRLLLGANINNIIL